MANPRFLKDVVLVQKCFLVNKKGEILTLQANEEDKAWPLVWEFPGGGYEYGEDTADSLRREVKEETNLKLNNFFPVYFTNVTKKPSWLAQAKTTLVICYGSKDWEGKLHLSPEHVDYRWEAPQKLLDYDFAGDAGFFHQALRAFLKLL
jgi:8-oxo-dGTP diphosphatase